MAEDYPFNKSERVEAKALERWPISDEKRRELLDGQTEIACDSDAKPRDRTRAFQAVLTADKMNQVDEMRGEFDGSMNPIETADVLAAMLRSVGGSDEATLKESIRNNRGEVERMIQEIDEEKPQ